MHETTPSLIHLWTWSGAFFGYRWDDNLWTYTGHHVGYLEGNTVFSLKGRYLGEIVAQRLLVNDTRKPERSVVVIQRPRHVTVPQLAALTHNSLYPGIEDFPLAETFET